MSDTRQDVALIVVNPSLPSRVVLTATCANDSNSAVDCPEPAILNSDENLQIKTEDEKNRSRDAVTDKQICCGKQLTPESENAGVDLTATSDSAEYIRSHTDAEGYISVSTDDTLYNSDSESESLKNQRQASSHETPEQIQTSTMGNQTSGKKNVHSDEDTPDDMKTKCCEIPKKKQKDRNSRAIRSSKIEDNDFDVGEVYPFDIRSRSEQELAEPVELEPFEIIETDDIKFVAGAGTSDVIKNAASEPKIKVIPEESRFEVDEQSDNDGNNENTDVKTPFVIDKGDRLLEPGTTTATSTFEFRQIKTKSKLETKVSQSREYAYEHFKLSTNATDSQANTDQVAIQDASASSSSTTTSSGSNRDSSTASSKDASRKNSKDAVNKPLRKNKSKTKSENEKVKTKDDSNKNEKRDKVKTPDLNKTSANGVENTNKSQNNEKMLILTQTMFSKSKTSKADLENNTVPSNGQNKYENVGVCAKLAQSGISIGHQEPSKQGDNGDHIEDTQETVDHIYQNEAIVSHTPSTELSSQSPQSVERMSPAPIYETIPSKTQGQSIEDNSNSFKTRVSNSILTPNKDVSQTPSSQTPDGDTSRAREDSVPPPSPSAMDVLGEEDEEEDEEYEHEIDTDNTQSAAIDDFTENICKRLSQLLEVMHPEDDIDDDEDDVFVGDDDDDDDDETDVKEIYSRHLETHFYETIPAKLKIDKEQDSKCQSTSKSPESVKENKKNENDIKQTDDMSNEDVKPLLRSDSSNTLKRISGDSNKYTTIEGQCSSDDDLPEYFDPRGMTPKRDSEILCDVLDAYNDETGVKSIEVSAKSISDIVDSNKLNLYETLDFNKKVDTDLSLSLKNADSALLRNLPKVNHVDEIQDRTPTAEAQPQFTPLPELAKAEEDNPVQFETYRRRSITRTESDLDISEHRDDLSTDSMLADDEDEETMEILFTKTYTEPIEGAEVFLSCTVVNSAYKEDNKKSETWLSDEALEYFEANAADVMSTAFMKAKKEMKDIQVCLQSLRKQMEHFHGDYDDISLPDIPVDSLSPDYIPRKAVTD